MHVFWLLTMRFFCSQVSGDSTPKFEVDKSHPESKSRLAVNKRSQHGISKCLDDMIIHDHDMIICHRTKSGGITRRRMMRHPCNFFETSHPGCTSRTANKVGFAMIIRDPFSVFFLFFGLKCLVVPCRFPGVFRLHSAPRGRNFRFGSDSSQAPSRLSVFLHQFKYI